MQIHLTNLTNNKNIEILTSYVSYIPSGLLTEKEVNIISSMLMDNINLPRSTYITV